MFTLLLYLHRSAGVEGMDVVGAGGEGTDGIFGKAEERVQVLLESLAHGGVKCTQDSGRAAAVALHAGHGGLSLHKVGIILP